eukprot:154958-Hanusia_phi.AAC.1
MARGVGWPGIEVSHSVRATVPECQCRRQLLCVRAGTVQPGPVVYRCCSLCASVSFLLPETAAELESPRLVLIAPELPAPALT